MRTSKENSHSDKQVGAPATIGSSGKRRFVYPDRRSGVRINRRKILALVLMVVYFAIPWISFNHLPLLRIDVLNDRASFFGFVLSMSEYNYVFYLFATLGLVLFLVTTLRGRVWCGYGCPQTVFVEWVIRPIEEWIEGNALKRQKADNETMTSARMAKKFLKHALFFGVALLVANAFLGYFVDPRLVLSWIIAPPSHHPQAFMFVLFVATLFYVDLGWFREQFCAFLCPYARIQSVLLDEHSPSVYYDTNRGEPRGRGRSKENSPNKEQNKPLGDCIDCGLCVRVCPTGIDIRNGLQLECIQCERCIDACNSIMTNIKRPVDLIRIDAPARAHGRQLRIWQRPRVWIYGLLIVFVSVMGFSQIMGRDTIELTFLRQAGSAYSKLDNGNISNLFTVRAVNHSGQPQKLSIQIQGSEEHPKVEIICPRCGIELNPYEEVVSPFIVVFDQQFQQGNITVHAAGSSNLHQLPLLGLTQTFSPK